MLMTGGCCPITCFLQAFRLILLVSTCRVDQSAKAANTPRCCSPTHQYVTYNLQVRRVCEAHRRDGNFNHAWESTVKNIIEVKTTAEKTMVATFAGCC